MSCRQDTMRAFRLKLFADEDCPNLCEDPRKFVRLQLQNFERSDTCGHSNVSVIQGNAQGRFGGNITGGQRIAHQLRLRSEIRDLVTELSDDNLHNTSFRCGKNHCDLRFSNGRQHSDKKQYSYSRLHDFNGYDEESSGSTSDDSTSDWESDSLDDFHYDFTNNDFTLHLLEKKLERTQHKLDETHMRVLEREKLQAKLKSQLKSGAKIRADLENKLSLAERLLAKEKQNNKALTETARRLKKGSAKECNMFHIEICHLRELFKLAKQHNKRWDEKKKHLEKIQENANYRYESCRLHTSTTNTHTHQVHALRDADLQQQNNVKEKLENANIELERLTNELMNLRDNADEKDTIHSHKIKDLTKRLKKFEITEMTLRQELQQSENELQKTTVELDDVTTRLNAVLQKTRLQLNEKEFIELSASKEATVLQTTLQKTRENLQKRTEEIVETKTRDTMVTNKSQLMEKDRNSHEVCDLTKALQKSEADATMLRQQSKLFQEKLQKTADELEDAKIRLKDALQMNKLTEKKHSQAISDLAKASESDKITLRQQLKQTQKELQNTTQELEDTKTRVNAALQKTSSQLNKHELSDVIKQLELSAAKEKTVLQTLLQQTTNTLQKRTEELEETKTMLRDAIQTNSRQLKEKDRSHSQELCDLTKALQKSKSHEMIRKQELKHISQENLLKTTEHLENAKTSTRLKDKLQLTKLTEQKHSKEISDRTKDLENPNLINRC